LKLKSGSSTMLKVDTGSTWIFVAGYCHQLNQV
jgi:hypothetical protein